jgi:hypothetical protein
VERWLRNICPDRRKGLWRPPDFFVAVSQTGLHHSRAYSCTQFSVRTVVQGFRTVAEPRYECMIPVFLCIWCLGVPDSTSAPRPEVEGEAELVSRSVHTLHEEPSRAGIEAGATGPVYLHSLLSPLRCAQFTVASHAQPKLPPPTPVSLWTASICVRFWHLIALTVASWELVVK